MLQSIIPSKTRRKILALFFNNIGSSYHLRRVGRETHEEINAVKRELDILERAKVLKKERRLNKSIYSLNHSYIFFNEFLRIFFKQASLVTSILKNQTKLGKVKYIAVSTKLPKREIIPESEIYLLFIGTIPAVEIAKILEREKGNYTFEINYTVMTEDEFAFRKRNNDPFIWKFLRHPKIMLIGSEEALLS